MRSTDLKHGQAEHAMRMSHGVPPKAAAAHMGHDRHAQAVKSLKPLYGKLIPEYNQKITSGCSSTAERELPKLRFNRPPSTALAKSILYIIYM